MIVFSSAFVITVGILSYTNITKAGWNNSITWTTKADFDGNAVSTGTATTNILADTSSNNEVKLTKPNDIGSTISAGRTNSVVVKNDGTVWGTGADIMGSFDTGPIFTGTGLNDLTVGGNYTGTTQNPKFTITVDGTNTIKTSGINSGGSGYAVNDTFTINNGTILAAGTVNSVNSGAVSTYTLTNNGAGYWVADGFGTTNVIGTGTGLTIDIDEIVSTFKWKKDSEAYTEKVQMTTTAQLLKEGVTVRFATTTGHSSTDNMNIIHRAGDVAPVDKNVVYGIVRTSISGADRYWLAQNLGATHQATSAIDNTETSGGWYWQYGRKQGYKYDGSRIPSSAWNTVSMTGDWAESADPCTTELGSGWRIPSATEWTNADGTPQNWANYTNTYSSVLKLHAAGLLNNTTGELENRGILGRYFSMNINGSLYGKALYFNSSTSKVEILTSNRTNGFSLRCLSSSAPAADKWTFSRHAAVNDNSEFIQITNGASSVSTGNGSNTFVIKQDGTLWASGLNNYGQLGLGNTTTQQGLAQTTLTNVKQVSNNSTNSIALKNDGTVWVTGQNANGELGLGNTDQITSWTQVTNANVDGQIISVATGSNASYLVKSTGTVWVAGLNTSGQLGLGDTDPRTTWTNAPALSDVKSISSFGTTALALTNTGTVWGTGANESGSLGIGSTGQNNTWVQSLITDVSAVATGSNHSLAVKSNGSLWATGLGTFGALGTGNTDSSSSWVSTGVTNAESVAAGSNHSIVRKTDGSMLVAGDNTLGQLGLIGNSSYLSFTDSLTNIKKSSGYLPTATISAFKIDAEDIDITGTQYKWETITWEGATPANTSVKFRTRSADTEGGLASDSWSDYYTTSGDIINESRSRWIEVEMTLNSTYGASTPTVTDFSVNYTTDKTAPTNPSAPALAWTSSAKTTALTNNEFGTDNKPYFEFSDAADGAEGSGIKEYYVYFGTSDSADPYTAGTRQNPLVNDPQTFTPASSITADGTYYLRVRTIDNALNKSEPITLFTYKYDSTAPISPSYITAAPFGWSTTNSFSFNWPAGSDEALYTSGLAGYQYKTGGTANDWSTGVLTTTELSISGIKSYQNGRNTFYVRSVDNVGNTGETRQVYFYYNGEAPSPPENLVVTPQSSIDSNSFSFEWDKPASYNGEIKGYRYSVNAVPQENNTTFINLSSLPPEVTYNTETGHVILSNIPAATVQGENYIYVVAVDINDNVSYGETGAKVGFDCNTPAPGQPTSIEAYDSSNRVTTEYTVTLKWRAPAQKGTGFKDYAVERSSDGTNFEHVGFSTGTSFIDNTDLASTTYYYRIITRDNTNNVSAPSEIVSILPTGKYTEAPLITIEPKVTSKITAASVNWVTDREASSFVTVSEDAKYDPTKNQQGQNDFTVDHNVELTGLKPDTLYHYRAVYVDQDSNLGYSDDGVFRTNPAPRVDRVNVQDIRLNTAIVTWYTSEAAESDLLYGKTTDYTTELLNVSGGATTVHSVRIDGLDHSSTYNFAIRIKDSEGNIILSDNYSFETLMFPKLSNIRFEPVVDSSTSSFKITWDSNVPTNSIVEFQPEGGKVQESVKSALELKHEIIIAGLIDNKFYLINTVGVDQYGNEAVSDMQRIKTNYDTRPPAILNVTSEASSTETGSAGKSQVVVSWETDEPSTSQVEYGLGSGTSYESKSQEDVNLTTSHVIVISGLRPSSAYHFRAVSKDESGNTGISEPQSVLTDQSRSSIFDVIVNSLQSSVGWLFGGSQ